MDKSKLALILSKLADGSKNSLLQLSLPSEIIAKILYTARKTIKNKIVYNLGCGTGRFAIGSALLGAKAVYGIDIERSLLDTAKDNMLYSQNLTGIRVSNICNWQLKNALSINEKCDTAIQFPPISNDIKFFAKALEIAKSVYSIHKPEREEELRRLARKYGCILTKDFLHDMTLFIAKS